MAPVTNSTEPKLIISLLGQFELRYNGVVIADNLNRSHKTWNILAYVVENKRRVIPQYEFIDTLWAEESITNPANALKTQFYRVRSLLDPLGIEGDGCIISHRGAYSWNGSLNCTVDADVFSRYCRRAADTTLPTEERISHYLHALDLYKGDYLPKLSSEAWTTPIRTHYHALYVESVKDCCKLFFEQKDYEAVIRLVTKAIKIESLDEQLYIDLIRAYIASNNQTAALKQYDMATEQLYKNLGINPSSELHALYREIMDTEKNIETDLMIIQNSLNEAAAINGAFVCEYGFFVSSYQLTARRLERLGLTAFLCLLTMAPENGHPLQPNQLDSSMKRLLDTIRYSLRTGDVVSRYSSTQYVILLPAASFESAEMVMSRIMNNYKRQNRYSGLNLSYKIREISPDAQHMKEKLL